MRWTHLVTLMDAEAIRQEQANDHLAAILLREGAEHIRAMRSCDARVVGERPTREALRAWCQAVEDAIDACGKGSGG